MDILDAGKFLKTQQDNFLEKPNVIPVSIKRLQIKSGRIDLGGKFREGQTVFIRLDSLRGMELISNISNQVDEVVAVVNLVDSNGGDLGWCPVELFEM